MIFSSISTLNVYLTEFFIDNLNEWSQTVCGARSVAVMINTNMLKDSYKDK